MLELPEVTDTSGGRKEKSPVTLKETLDYEIAWQERIAAIPGEKMKAYLEREFTKLPILTQAMLEPDLPWEFRPESLEIDSYTANQIFCFLGYPAKKYGGNCQALADRYGENHQEAWRLYQAHKIRIAEVKKEGEDAQKAASEEYMAHYRTLTEEQRPIANYAMARQVPPGSTSGFHFRPSSPSVWPFSYYSWADTKPVPGVAFSIGRACFAGRDPLLFYALSDYEKISRGTPLEKAVFQTGDGWRQKVYPTIEGYSSGIRTVGFLGGIILFRLDEEKIRRLDIFYSLPKEEKQENYVFTWPGAGEFSCILGEIADGKLIPLYLDDFVMK